MSRATRGQRRSTQECIFPIGKATGLSKSGCLKYSRSVNSVDIDRQIGHNIPDREYYVTIEEIGAVVRQARLAQGLRQDQLAAAAGVGLRFLVELERGKPTVRLAKVLAVLNALGCRLEVTPPPTGRSDA